METQKRSKKELITLILVGVMIGLMLTGTAFAASYLTKPKAQKLFLENTKTYAADGFSISPATSQTLTVNCPAGWQALGGGVQSVDLNQTSLIVRYSGPMVAGDNLVAAANGKNPASTGWTARLSNTSGGQTFTGSIGVICAE